MTFEEALKAEIGDILFSVFTSSNYKENDEVILVERARDINGMENDTGGMVLSQAEKRMFWW